MKNRTHWEDPEVLGDIVAQFTDCPVLDGAGFKYVTFTLHSNISYGDVYKVSIPGMVDCYLRCYESTIQIDEHNTRTVPTLGYRYVDGFVVECYDKTAKIKIYTEISQDMISLTIRNEPSQRIHKLDSKYLPDADLELVISDYADETFTARDIKINAGSIEGVCTKLAICEMPKVIIRSHTSYGPGYSDHERIYPVYHLFRYGESLEIKYSEPVRQTGSGAVVMSLYTISFSVDGAFQSHSVENYSLSTSTV